MLSKIENKPITTHERMDITDIIGKYGTWQKLLTFLFLLRGVPSAWHTLSTPLLAPETDHWCARPLAYRNWSVQEWKNYTIPWYYDQNNQLIYEKCVMYDLENRNQTVGCSSWEYDSSFYTSTIVTDFNLVCNREWMISLTQSIFMGGMMAGVFIFGHIADIYGRRLTLLICATGTVTCGFAIAMSPNFIFFSIFRFLVAMAVSGMQNTAFCLLIEVVSKDHRTMVSFAFSYGWAAGLIIFPGMAWLLRDWMHLEIAIAAPSTVLLLYFCFIPESPRWLLTRGRYAESKDILKQAAIRNKQDTSNFDEQFCNLVESMEKESKIKHSSIFDLFRTPKLAKATIKIFVSFFCVAFVYYGLSLTTPNLGGSIFLNFFLQAAVEVPGYTLCIIAIRYMNRRPALIGCFAVSGIVCLLLIPVPESLLWLKITLATLGKLTITSAFNLLWVHSAEIFPTILRTIGTGSGNTVGRIGSTISPFTKELGEATHPSLPFALFGSLGLFACLMIWLLPETRNENLLDTVKSLEMKELDKQPQVK